MNGRVNKYCFDCGTRLKYVPALSTPRLPNEFRHLAYTCEKCNLKNDVETEKYNPQLEQKIKIILVNRQSSESPVETISMKIEEFKDISERHLKGQEKLKRHWEKMRLKKEMMATPEMSDNSINC